MDLTQRESKMGFVMTEQVDVERRPNAWVKRR